MRSCQAEGSTVLQEFIERKSDVLSDLTQQEIANKLGTVCFITKPDRFSDLKTYLSEVTGALEENRVETLSENPLLRRKLPR